jgi:hypothetical protein
VRRGTAITLVILFSLLVIVAIVQLTLASGDRTPLPGPTRVGELPTPPTSP